MTGKSEIWAEFDDGTERRLEPHEYGARTMELFLAKTQGMHQHELRGGQKIMLLKHSHPHTGEWHKHDWDELDPETYEARTFDKITGMPEFPFE